MKQRTDISDSQKQQHTDARSAKARKWARLMVFCLMCLSLSAIWQDKRLAPPVHLGMQKVAGMAMEYIEDSETLSEVLAAAQKNYAQLASDG